jgi:hypothetical protein
VNNKQRLDDLDAWVPPPAPAFTREEKLQAIVADIRWRWSLATNDAVNRRKVKPGERGPFPRRDDLMTWEDVPRELWGKPPHLRVRLIDPVSLFFICNGRSLRLLELLEEGARCAAAFDPGATARPARPRHWRRCPGGE